MRVFTPPVLDRKIRFALVGCGRIAQSHINAMRQHADRIELTDVCDVDPAALQKAVEDTGAVGHRKLSDMLASTTADIVVLTTPSGLHPEQAVEIAAAGKHVMTEKPMATRLQDGVRMVKACDEAGVRLFVVKQNRRNATLQLLKRAMEKRRFGRLYMININVFWTRPQSYYDSASWRGTWEFDGGAFMNQASHYVDLLEWLGGPLESVQAYTATLARNIEVEDSGVIGLRWRSGALGSVNVTMLTYPQNLEGSITIIGEKGTVRIGGVAVNEIQQWQFAESDPDDEAVASASYETTSVYGFGHPLYYDNVIQVLRGEAEPETDGREGLKSLEVLIAAYMSARDGKRVALPLEY
ncbi:Gfo/Idh/MocA family protein [Streptomyces sp. NPDC056465]|uniref:Gfo/Idh/MocA family oxidoreductase n=2 Tax=Bacteria TaxID=2 RepID=A0ABY7Y2J1_9GAMM|nr:MULTISPECIES: Gfo/Idh/MocA family oxidoreductase [Stenotrophomonas]ALA81076.1 oxidoreductase [Stenotrophomonas maltophilia]MBA0434507.1 gfo/Idh/MocA family oxidoreductase [Stenotrophomonas maltophilia]MBH1477532.1 Gfo/Idh/MocA family oxidoreductase [Stenotrophomonas maltophilia]MBH1502614.1 Gfo/Idh/MocA family oxidoreductase [Stenotrophomonas maltophilia]MBH1787475.1 Gfo/Idh/MocA family oxidoreductase [Stenotrophomonas maltophilia]